MAIWMTKVWNQGSYGSAHTETLHRALSAFTLKISSCNSASACWGIRVGALGFYGIGFRALGFEGLGSEGLGF